MRHLTAGAMVMLLIVGCYEVSGSDEQQWDPGALPKKPATSADTDGDTGGEFLQTFDGGPSDAEQDGDSATQGNEQSGDTDENRTEKGDTDSTVKTDSETAPVPDDYGVVSPVFAGNVFGGGWTDIVEVPGEHEPARLWMAMGGSLVVSEPVNMPSTRVCWGFGSVVDEYSDP